MSRFVIPVLFGFAMPATAGPILEHQLVPRQTAAQFSTVITAASNVTSTASATDNDQTSTTASRTAEALSCTITAQAGPFQPDGGRALSEYCDCGSFQASMTTSTSSGIAFGICDIGNGPTLTTFVATDTATSSTSTSTQTGAANCAKDGSIVEEGLCVEIDGETWPKDANDADFWCRGAPDLTLEDEVSEIWEGELKVGLWFDKWLSSLDTADKWPETLADQTGINFGDAELSGCGVSQGICTPPGIRCEVMVEKGFGPAYWIFRALAIFHAKLNKVTADYGFTTTRATLSFDKIVADFATPPEEEDQMAEIASLLSGGLFLLGGFGGVFVSTVSFITASTTAAAAPAIAKGAKGRTKGLEGVSAPLQAWMEKNVEEMVENAKDQREQKVDKLGKSSRYGGAQAAGSYIIGSTFSTLGSGLNFVAEDPTEFDRSLDLQVAYNETMVEAQEQIKVLGRLAVGRAQGDESYDWLPNESGIGGEITSPIAGFFSDGKMLMGGDGADIEGLTNLVWGQQLTQLVDRALSSGKYRVAIYTQWNNIEDCLANFGAQWIEVPKKGSAETEFLCFVLMQEDNSSPGDGLKFASDDIYNKMQDDYAMNMINYFKATYDCAINADKAEDEPNPIPPPSDLPPTCMYRLKTGKVNIDFKEVCTWSVATNTGDCNTRCEKWEDL